MQVRGLALFAGIVLLASWVAAKKKEKQVLPDTVLRAQTVFVVIQPDAKEPLKEPNANLKAQKAVEDSLMKWGKFRLALDTTTADIIISVWAHCRSLSSLRRSLHLLVTLHIPDSMPLGALTFPRTSHVRR